MTAYCTDGQAQDGPEGGGMLTSDSSNVKYSNLVMLSACQYAIFPLKFFPRQVYALAD